MNTATTLIHRALRFPGGIGALVLIVWLGMPSIAGAEPPDDPERAEQYYQAGTESYHQGDYERAIELFQKAYQYAPNSVLLYNLALAQWRAADLETAVETMESALHEGLGGELEEHARLRLEAWERARETRWRAETTGREVVQRQSERLADGEPDVPDDPDGGFGAIAWTGVVTTVAGISGLAGAAVLNHRIGRYGERLQADPPPGPVERSEVLEDIERHQRTGVSLLIGGSVLTAAGLSMVWFGRQSGEARSAAVDQRGWGIEFGLTVGGASIAIERRWK